MATANTRLLWTPAWQAKAQAMVKEGSYWTTTIKKIADASPDPSTRHYGDFGQYSTMAYQIWGDPAYAANAWSLLTPLVDGSKPLWSRGANEVRQLFAILPIMYDWLRPWLTLAQRSQFRNALYRVVDWCFTLNSEPFSEGAATGHGGGWRVTDTDQTLGQWGGCVLTANACAADDPGALAILDKTFSPALNQGVPNPTGPAGGFMLPLGGVVATAANRDTVRNAVCWYIEKLCAGGADAEGTEYGQNTLQILLMIYRALATCAAGSMPEVDTLLPDLAINAAHELQPGNTCAWMMGDVENDEQFASILRARLSRRVSYHVCILGTADKTKANLYPLAAATRVLLGADLTSSPLEGFDWRGLLLGDPSCLNTVEQALPAVHVAEGVGVLHWRSGPTAAHFAAVVNEKIDHRPEWMGDWELFVQGNWAFKHPQGYGGPASGPYGVNGFALCGLGAMQDRTLLAAEGTADYAHLCCETSGPFYPSNYFHPPQPFARWRRHLLWHQKSSTLIVDDTVNFLCDPRQQDDFKRYTGSDRVKMTAALALGEWIVHMPVEPSVLSGTSFGWASAGFAPVSAEILSPAAPAIITLDETALWGKLTSNYNLHELAWQLRLGVNTVGPNRVCVALRLNGKPQASAIPNGVITEGIPFIWSDAGPIAA